MTTMNISLPEQLKQHVDQRVANHAYGSSSEYIRELIRRDQALVAEQELAGLIRAGLESGDAVKVDADYWQNKTSSIN